MRRSLAQVQGSRDPIRIFFNEQATGFLICRLPAPSCQFIVPVGILLRGWYGIAITRSEMDLKVTQLQAATQTFHLLHHRNKNQHQHSRWWKWFSMLRRCVSNLIYEIQTRDELRVQARVKHMNQVLLPKCYA